MTDVETYEEVAVTETNDDSQSDTYTPEYACIECGKELRYGGRGRKPKYCDEHKKNAPKGTRTSSTGRKSSGWQKSLADSLTAQVTGIGVAVSMFDRFDGLSIINGAENLSTSLVTVAENNDKVRRALETFVTGSTWAGVAVAVTQIAFPILMHHNIIPAIPGMKVTEQTAA